MPCGTTFWASRVYQLRHLVMFSSPCGNRTRLFGVGQVSWPLDHGAVPVAEAVGVEPTGTRLSTSPLCQFAYPVVAGPGVAPGGPGL